MTTRKQMKKYLIIILLLVSCNVYKPTFYVVKIKPGSLVSASEGLIFIGYSDSVIGVMLDTVWFNKKYKLKELNK
jgi:hypothetical protein